MKNHSAAEGGGDLGHSPADIPHSYDTPDLSLQFIKREVKIRETVLSAVLPGLDIIVIIRQLLADRKSVV